MHRTKMIVRAVTLPDGALVARYRLRGDYVDCFGVDVPGAETIAAFVEAFFSAPTFRGERWVLALVGLRARRDDLSAIASGAGAKFAAWTVEARAPNEILLCDILAFTRCWLMAAPSPDRPDTTRLYFGTAFVKGERRRVSNVLLRAVFAALRPLHSFYARVLLGGAARRLSI